MMGTEGWAERTFRLLRPALSGVSPLPDLLFLECFLLEGSLSCEVFFSREGSLSEDFPAEESPFGKSLCEESLCFFVILFNLLPVGRENSQNRRPAHSLELYRDPAADVPCQAEVLPRHP